MHVRMGRTPTLMELHCKSKGCTWKQRNGDQEHELVNGYIMIKCPACGGHDVIAVKYDGMEK